MRITHNLLRKLPKVELHCHLDGSLRLNSIISFAEKDSVVLPSKNASELKNILSVGPKGVTLDEYINKFQITLSVLQTSANLEKAAFELIEDVAKENVRYIEVRYSPILHTQREMTPEETIKAVSKGLKKGKDTYGVESGIIICGIRNISPETSLMLAELTVKYKNRGVVGFDLAGSEENFPAKDHKNAFYTIRNKNINATIHAGEAFGSSSIHQAIHYCGAHRIGHGTRLKEDPDLMNYVNDHRITLEICLTSNLHTRSVQSLKNHPLKFYLDQGIRVTLNTDNRLMSDTTLTDEFLLAHKLFDLGLSDFREITITAMKSAFLSYDKRKQLIKSIAEELESDFGLMPEFIS